MTAKSMTLLTIISEAMLEAILADEIIQLGAKGYTVTDARGCGTHGVRRGNWTAGGNVRFDVVGDAELCARIVARLKEVYERDYGLLMYTSPVELQN